MLLFICHTSEDKVDFVEPLAAALKEKFEVWYDKYVLVLGDSLLGKIDEGLSRCDFGVVVLSPAFFRKRWTRAELDGLFARETTSHKIILPIWKDVSKDEVLGFSPILAGRLAVSASEGLSAVVAEIERAVQTSQRTREISVLQSAADRLKRYDQTLREKRDSDRLLQSEEGVRLFCAELQSLFKIFREVAGQVAEKMDVLKFTFPASREEEFYALTNTRVSLNIAQIGGSANSATQVMLVAKIFLRNTLAFGERGTPEVLKTLEFRPVFNMTKRVAWVADRDGLYSTEELAAYLLDEITQEIQSQLGGDDAESG